MSKTSTKLNIDSLNSDLTDNPVEKDSFEPSDDVINNILNYSKALSIHRSQTVEHIEVVLN